MKKENSVNCAINENDPIITRNAKLHRFTEENSPFIKRKMEEARAILSKAPFPGFKDQHKKENTE
jgi:hypothetical protein